MSKRAVLIGCNYPGTKAELKGCIHDVQRMHRSLLDRYKFPAENITVLIDTDSSYVQPTGQNIRSALSDLVAAANPGDILFVHYSGHGTRLPAEDDDTGYDECIVPTDMNLITDDDFREFVDKVPEKCIITIVSDSCHSGGLINAAKEQIGESTQRNKTGLRFFKSISATAADAISSHNNRHRDDRQGSGYFQNKSLPLSTLIEILKQKTGKNDIEVGKLRPTLFDIFGDDASPKLRKFLKAVRKFVRHDRDEGCSKKQEGGILISGCQSDESAGDTMPEGEPDEAYGVLSNAIQMIIAERDGKVSNQEVVRRARKLLKKQGFTQHPGLYCSDEHVDAPFVCYI